MDLVGIDVNLAAARGIFDGALAAEDPLAERFRPSPTQERLVDEGRLGRKSGEGFYRYDATSGRPAPHLGADDEGERITGPEIAERLRLAIAAEAYRAFDAGVATAAEIDLAMRLGAGHPVGPIEWAEALGGRDAVEARLRAMESLGPRFHLRPSRV
jgi:3-hydroxybutyryl-CoA dehydrogenase